MLDQAPFWHQGPRMVYVASLFPSTTRPNFEAYCTLWKAPKVVKSDEEERRTAPTVKYLNLALRPKPRAPRSIAYSEKMRCVFERNASRQRISAAPTLQGPSINAWNVSVWNAPFAR